MHAKMRPTNLRENQCKNKTIKTRNIYEIRTHNTYINITIIIVVVIVNIVIIVSSSQHTIFSDFAFDHVCARWPPLQPLLCLFFLLCSSGIYIRFEAPKFTLIENLCVFLRFFLRCSCCCCCFSFVLPICFIYLFCVHVCLCT